MVEEKEKIKEKEFDELNKDYNKIIEELKQTWHIESYKNDEHLQKLYKEITKFEDKLKGQPKQIFDDLQKKLKNLERDLEYPQKDYAYLLHKKDLERLKKKWCKEC